MKIIELIRRAGIDDRHSGNGPTTPKISLRKRFYTASARSGRSPDEGRLHLLWVEPGGLIALGGSIISSTSANYWKLGRRRERDER